eukprot:2164220-Rhodomonas_salina.1
MDSDGSLSRSKKQLFAGFRVWSKSKKHSINVGDVLSQGSNTVLGQGASDSDDSLSRGKKNIFFGYSFQGKKHSIDLDGELSNGNNTVHGQKNPDKKGWVGSMMSMLKGGKTQSRNKPNKSKKSTNEHTVTSEVANPELALDSNGEVLCEPRQVRIKSMQYELLQLVKAAEKGGRVRVMRRRETESISMPGIGVIQLESVTESPPGCSSLPTGCDFDSV